MNSALSSSAMPKIRVRNVESMMSSPKLPTEGGIPSSEDLMNMTDLFDPPFSNEAHSNVNRRTLPSNQNDSPMTSIVIGDVYSEAQVTPTVNGGTSIAHNPQAIHTGHRNSVDLAQEAPSSTFVIGSLPNISLDSINNPENNINNNLISQLPPSISGNGMTAIPPPDSAVQLNSSDASRIHRLFCEIPQTRILQSVAPGQIVVRLQGASTTGELQPVQAQRNNSYLGAIPRARSNAPPSAQHFLNPAQPQTTKFRPPPPPYATPPVYMSRPNTSLPAATGSASPASNYTSMTTILHNALAKTTPKLIQGTYVMSPSTTSLSPGSVVSNTYLSQHPSVVYVTSRVSTGPATSDSVPSVPHASNTYLTQPMFATPGSVISNTIRPQRPSRSRVYATSPRYATAVSVPSTKLSQARPFAHRLPIMPSPVVYNERAGPSNPSALSPSNNGQPIHISNNNYEPSQTDKVPVHLQNSNGVLPNAINGENVLPTSTELINNIKKTYAWVCEKRKKLNKPKVPSPSTSASNLPWDAMLRQHIPAIVPAPVKRRRKKRKPKADPKLKDICKVIITRLTKAQHEEIEMFGFLQLKTNAVVTETVASLESTCSKSAEVGPNNAPFIPNRIPLEAVQNTSDFLFARRKTKITDVAVINAVPIKNIVNMAVASPDKITNPQPVSTDGNPNSIKLTTLPVAQQPITKIPPQRVLTEGNLITAITHASLPPVVLQPITEIPPQRVLTEGNPVTALTHASLPPVVLQPITEIPPQRVLTEGNPITVITHASLPPVVVQPSIKLHPQRVLTEGNPSSAIKHVSIPPVVSSQQVSTESNPSSISLNNNDSMLEPNKNSVSEISPQPLASSASNLAASSSVKELVRSSECPNCAICKHKFPHQDMWINFSNFQVSCKNCIAIFHRRPKLQLSDILKKIQSLSDEILSSSENEDVPKSSDRSLKQGRNLYNVARKRTRLRKTPERARFASNPSIPQRRKFNVLDSSDSD